MERIGAAEFGLPACVIGAAHVFALGLAEGEWCYLTGAQLALLAPDPAVA